MRIQGALASLTSVLGEDALTYGGKLDIVETLSRLLLQSAENQKEFRRMEGYSTLQQLFDKIVWEPLAESAVFVEVPSRRSPSRPAAVLTPWLAVQDCFNLFFTIALDGNKDMVAAAAARATAPRR
jgi:hypothetical protein